MIRVKEKPAVSISGRPPKSWYFRYEPRCATLGVRAAIRPVFHALANFYIRGRYYCQRASDSVKVPRTLVM